MSQRTTCIIIQWSGSHAFGISKPYLTVMDKELSVCVATRLIVPPHTMLVQCKQTTSWTSTNISTMLQLFNTHSCYCYHQRLFAYERKKRQTLTQQLGGERRSPSIGIRDTATSCYMQMATFYSHAFPEYHNTVVCRCFRSPPRSTPSSRVLPHAMN